MACIYLIQPKEYIGTGTCKVGMSRKNDLQRVKSYGKGTRFLCIMECEDPFRLEKKIIEKFNDSFQKIQGNEYFCHCGFEDEMIKLFIEIVLEHKIVDRKDEEVKGYLTDSDSEDIESILTNSDSEEVEGGSDIRSFFNTPKSIPNNSDSEDLEPLPPLEERTIREFFKGDRVDYMIKKRKKARAAAKARSRVNKYN